MTLFQWMKKPQDFPGASAERRVLGGRVAAAPSATHVDVCNERVRVDKGKHFMGPHDVTQTTSSQSRCFQIAPIERGCFLTCILTAAM